MGKLIRLFYGLSLRSHILIHKEPYISCLNIHVHGSQQHTVAEIVAAENE